jgi:hypothetical protein
MEFTALFFLPIILYFLLYAPAEALMIELLGINAIWVALCGLNDSVIATRPKVRGFKPAKYDGFLRVIKICSMTSFGVEVKPSVPCHRFTACKRILQAWKRCSVGKIQQPYFIAHVSPALLLDESAGKNCQRNLADESGLIRNCVRQWACDLLLNKALNRLKILASLEDQTVLTDVIELIKCWW